MILNLCDTFHSNAISWNAISRNPPTYTISNSYQEAVDHYPPVDLAEALGRLWGRSFPTSSQIYWLHWYDLCSEGMLYGSPCSMLNAVSWLYCTDSNLHNHLRVSELASELACEFHPATHGTMKRNYELLCWMITWCEIDGSFESKAEI